MKTYTITKKFIGGMLDGITVEESVRIKFVEGEFYASPFGGGAYQITSVIEQSPSPDPLIPCNPEPLNP